MRASRSLLNRDVRIHVNMSKTRIVAFNHSSDVADLLFITAQILFFVFGFFPFMTAWGGFLIHPFIHRFTSSSRQSYFTSSFHHRFSFIWLFDSFQELCPFSASEKDNGNTTRTCGYSYAQIRGKHDDNPLIHTFLFVGSIDNGHSFQHAHHWCNSRYCWYSKLCSTGSFVETADSFRTNHAGSVSSRKPRRILNNVPHSRFLSLHPSQALQRKQTG